MLSNCFIYAVLIVQYNPELFSFDLPVCPTGSHSIRDLNVIAYIHNPTQWIRAINLICQCKRDFMYFNVPNCNMRISMLVKRDFNILYTYLLPKVNGIVTHHACTMYLRSYFK